MKTRLALSIMVAASGVQGQAADKAPSWRDFPGIDNTSFVEPSGDRAIQLSAMIPAAPHEVFNAFATSDGFKSWAAPIAKIDLRVGGEIEASYNPAAQLGNPENIRNRIVAYVPDRLLVLQNVQAPSSLPGRLAFGRTVTIVEFLPAENGTTRVQVTNAGYGKGADFDAAYRHFEWGDAYTLAELRKRFEK